MKTQVNLYSSGELSPAVELGKARKLWAELKHEEALTVMRAWPSISRPEAIELLNGTIQVNITGDQVSYLSGHETP